MSTRLSDDAIWFVKLIVSIDIKPFGPTLPVSCRITASVDASGIERIEIGSFMNSGEGTLVWNSLLKQYLSSPEELCESFPKPHDN